MAEHYRHYESGRYEGLTKAKHKERGTRPKKGDKGPPPKPIEGDYTTNAPAKTPPKAPPVTGGKKWRYGREYDKERPGNYGVRG